MSSCAVNRATAFCSRPSPFGQRGVALITALFIASLAVIAGIAMFSATNMALHRTSNLNDSEAEYWYADGVESWLVMMLEEDARSHDVDSLADPWARPVQFLPIERGSLNGKIEDLQGRFNLNNLGALNPQPYINQFERLVAGLQLSGQSSAVDIAYAVRDWIDSDSIPATQGGAEDDYYIGLTPAYRTAARLMVTPSELLSVKGVTPALYSAIEPYIAALPTTSSKINLNTAPLLVLESLFDSGTKMDAAFIETRLQSPVRSVQEAVNAGIFPKDTDLSQLADVSSQYFLLRTTVSIGKGQTEMFSVIYRPRGAAARVILRTFGAQ